VWRNRYGLWDYSDANRTLIAVGENDNHVHGGLYHILLFHEFEDFERSERGILLVRPVSVHRKCLPAQEIADELGKWIENKEFYLTEKHQSLPSDTVFKPLEIKEKIPFVSEVMVAPVVTAKAEDSVENVSSLIVKNKIDQIPIVDDKGKIAGIVTSWDITNAAAKKKTKVADIMTSKVITSKVNEPLDVVAQRIDKYQINSTPVVEKEGKVVGIVTLSDVNKYYQRRG